MQAGIVNEACYRAKMLSDCSNSTFYSSFVGDINLHTQGITSKLVGKCMHRIAAS